MLTPEEIRNLDLTLSMRGYDREQVDGLLDEIRESYAAVWNDRTRLYDQVRELQAELAASKATIDELVAHVEQMSTARTDVLAELDALKALERVRAKASEQTPEQTPEREQVRDGNQTSPADIETPLNGLRRPLRDMPFEALRDYVMQRFELHNRSDDPNETE